MFRSSVRVVVAVLFVLVNLALVATPAGADWDWRMCVTESGEPGECCQSCWFFCDGCRGLDDDNDDREND